MLRDRPFVFYGGWEDDFGPAHVGALLFFCMVGFWIFFSQDHAYNNKQKVFYISVGGDLYMDTRPIKCLVL